MHVLAIVPSASPDPDRASKLATATGLAAYDTSNRLRVLGGWAGVLATFGESAHATAVAAAAQGLGFGAWVLPEAPAGARCVIRRFSVHEGTLTVLVDTGQTYAVPAGHVRHFVQGVRFTVKTQWGVERATRVGSLASAAMGYGGVGAPASVSSQVRTHEPFVLALVPGGPALLFAEGSLHCAATPQGPTVSTRKANFDRVVAQLREACPTAVWDDRLQQRGHQARMLGPTLRPEQHLDIAIALVTGAPLPAHTPYR